MGFERGFTKEVYFSTLKILPIMWIIVVLLVRLVAGPLVGIKLCLNLLVKQTASMASFAMRKLHENQTAKEAAQQ